MNPTHEAAKEAGNVIKSVSDITFGQAWMDGGPIMWVLAGVSVLALAVMLYLWVSQASWIFLPSALKRMERAKDYESEGRRIASRLHAAVDWLADIAAIAPLIGLLGTVLGMFTAFKGVSFEAGAKPVVLAEGVSQAIVTTIFGLVVAIPCLAAYAFFRRRAQNRVNELELAVEDILAAAKAGAVK